MKAGVNIIIAEKGNIKRICPWHHTKSKFCHKQKNLLGLQMIQAFYKVLKKYQLIK